jgi:hypothetical protein
MCGSCEWEDGMHRAVAQPKFQMVSVVQGNNRSPNASETPKQLIHEKQVNTDDTSADAYTVGPVAFGQKERETLGRWPNLASSIKISRVFADGPRLFSASFSSSEPASEPASDRSESESSPR